VYTANEPAQALKDGKVIHAMRITGAAPVIDGSITDEAWSAAETGGGYVQRDPDNGAAMTERTRIQVAYDDRYLYVAVVCEDSVPGGIAGGLSRREEFGSTDFVGIGFDPRHDHLTAYVFQTNASSVQADFSLSDDDRFDREYNSVWEVRTGVGPAGWAAEFRIPFSQMRFAVTPEPGQVWGFQAERMIRRKGETGTWTAKPRGQRGEVSLYGHLVFDTALAPSSRIEVVPYTLFRAERDGAADPGPTGDIGGAMGADLRIGLGSSATLAATVNPDFGQVEQDPAVLNLSVFETFYPEKRPFFLEDNRSLVPPYFIMQLFHSRRIGRAPTHFDVNDDDDVIDRSDETTIIGATKVTGKSGVWSYGALTAATAPEFATVERPDGSRYEHLAEPLTSYNVMRLQRDILGGTSNVGALMTGVVREKSDDAYAAALDYNLRWDQNRTVLNGHWAATRAAGDNGLRTSGGGIANFNLMRRHWNTWTHFDHFGRDFRINDLGFFRVRPDRSQLDGGFNLEQPDPGARLRRYGGNVCGGRGWNGDRLVFDSWLCTNGFIGFLNFWNVNGGATRRFETLDDIDTRGGPPIVRPAWTSAYFNVDSDSRKSWRLNVGSHVVRGDAGGSEQGMSASLSFQPSGRLQVAVSTRYTKALDLAQWIENSDTDADGADDHVYGTLRRNVVDITLRGTYSVHRDLSVQAYLQPFVAVGDYDHIRRLARPRSFDFEPVTIDDDPDFNRKSLRGNVVLRWEYVRGSTLFVVWDLSQEDESRPGAFHPTRDLRDVFGAPAKQVVMAKITYWFNR
jgi:hypothetical protein